MPGWRRAVLDLRLPDAADATSAGDEQSWISDYLVLPGLLMQAGDVQFWISGHLMLPGAADATRLVLPGWRRAVLDFRLPDVTWGC
jgi:hypothetical protein